jgi:hypothetical protein
MVEELAAFIDTPHARAMGAPPVRRWHSLFGGRKRDDCMNWRSMPAFVTPKTGRTRESMVKSGQFGTLWDRMQWKQASSWEVAKPPPFDEPLEPVDDGLPLHAIGSTTWLAVRVMVAAVRPVGGHARRGRYMRWMVWFIMVSSRFGDRAGRRAHGAVAVA